MLSVNQLTFKEKKKTLIDELTLNVAPGSFYALLGRKGAGKTTLLRLCAGLLEPKSGNIYINGMDVSKRENKKNVLRILGYMGSQDGYFSRLQVMVWLQENAAWRCSKWGILSEEQSSLWRSSLPVSEESFHFCVRFFTVRVF